MRLRSLALGSVAAATALVAALSPVATPRADAVTGTPASTVCTTAGSCVKVTWQGTVQFTVTVTCRATEPVAAGVRAYVASGNYSTSPTHTTNCIPGKVVTEQRYAIAIGSKTVGYRACLGAVFPRLGPYLGASIPDGGHELGPDHGFHWD